MNGKLNYTAVILAGGKNSRFGGNDKSFVRIYGERMIDRIIRELHSVFSEIILVTNSPEKYTKNDCLHITTDLIKNSGPLGGLHAAFKLAAGDTLFLVSCDMPFINNDLIKQQIQEFEMSGKQVLIPMHGKLLEPMHSVISHELSFTLDSYLLNTPKKKLLDFLILQSHAFWFPEIDTEQKSPFININSYEELADNGLFGFIAVLGYGEDAPGSNLSIAKEVGTLLATTGWGIAVGNTLGTFKAVSQAALREGGVAKLIFCKEGLSGEIETWPLTEEMPDRISKWKQIANTSVSAVVIGGGEGTRNLINEFLSLRKKVIFINGTGGVTNENLPDVVYVNSAREAMECINKSQKET